MKGCTDWRAWQFPVTSLRGQKRCRVRLDPYGNQLRVVYDFALESRTEKHGRNQSAWLRVGLSLFGRGQHLIFEQLAALFDHI